MGIHSDEEDQVMKISEALDSFFGKFAVARMANMSPSQKKELRKPQKACRETLHRFSGGRFPSSCHA